MDPATEKEDEANASNSEQQQYRFRIVCAAQQRSFGARIKSQQVKSLITGLCRGCMRLLHDM